MKVCIVSFADVGQDAPNYVYIISIQTLSEAASSCFWFSKGVLCCFLSAKNDLNDLSDSTCSGQSKGKTRFSKLM